MGTADMELIPEPSAVAVSSQLNRGPWCPNPWLPALELGVTSLVTAVNSGRFSEF